MPYEPFTTAGDLQALVENIVNTTRPTTQGQIFQALSYGIGKVVRAILSVRPQFFLTYTDPFAISATVSEYDISRYIPPLRRPVQLTVPGTQPILFRYKSLVDPEFEVRVGLTSGTSRAFFYDVLHGMLPRTPVQAIGFIPPDVIDFNTVLTQDQIAAAMPIGSTVLLPNAGLLVNNLRRHLYTTIVDLAGTTIRIGEPYQSESGAYGSIPTRAVVPVWRRMLKLAPEPASDYTGRLYYDYAPGDVLDASDEIDPTIADFKDCIVEYALWMLLRAVNESDAADHLAAANDLRAELIQHMEPLSGQNSEAMSSGVPDD